MRYETSDMSDQVKGVGTANITVLIPEIANPKKNKFYNRFQQS